MASFTDIIPQFNPYVEQLPVETMVAVGMEKQKRYDEGIQKIQSQIDNVAGLDIYKPVHKMYLQSKLNELGNNLKVVAAGDFSNFQLVNSVGGMVNQIIKDPTIQNAVLSTQRIRNQDAIQDKAKQDGKSSIQNEDFYSEQKNAWLNDGNVNSLFTGEYIPYTNIDEKLRKVYEKLKEEKNSADIPWKTDDQGNVLFFKKDTNGRVIGASTDPSGGGEKELDLTMQRIKTSGITAQRILNNFMSSLTENDKRQLMIDSRYFYKGVTKDSLVNDLYNTVSNQKRILHDSVVDMAVDLQKNDKLTPKQVREYEAAIATGNAMLGDGTFEKMYTQGAAEIEGIKDLDSYKYKLYTEKTLTNLAKDLQVINREEQIVNNPIWRALFDKKKFEFSAKMQQANLGIARARLAIAQSAEQRAQQKWAFELQELVEKAELDNPVTYELPLDPKDVRFSSDEVRTDARTELLTQRGTLNNDYGPRIFPDLKGNARQDALDKLYMDFLDNPTKLKNSDAVNYIRARKQVESQYDNYTNLANSATTYANQQLARLGPLSTEESAQKKVDLEADFISQRLAVERGGRYGGLNPKGKATGKALKSLITNKLGQLRTQGTLGSDANADENTLVIAAENVENTVPVLRKNDDGSGVLTIDVVQGEGSKKTVTKQVIPLSPQEMIMHFPRFSYTNPLDGMKKKVLQTGTTNAFGDRNAAGAEILGFDIPGIVGTGFDITTRLDLEGHKSNNGGSFDRFKVVMYSLQNSEWKKGEISDYVNEDVVGTILSQIGPGTVQAFNKKNN